MPAAIHITGGWALVFWRSGAHRAPGTDEVLYGTEEGRMRPIKNSEGYSCRLWDTWNDAARLALDTAAPAETAKKFERLGEMFAHKLIFSIVYPYERSLRDEGADAAAAFDQTGPYTEVTSKFTQGDIPSWDFTHETCRRTGLPLILSFENWVAKGGHQRQPSRRHQLAAGCKKRCWSSRWHLLVADRFRINEFTQQ
jgi:hypothetical protein